MIKPQSLIYAVPLNMLEAFLAAFIIKRFS
jgi:hypothetical protein